jgi:hypothetical protein
LLAGRKECECASSAHSPVGWNSRAVRGYVLTFLLGVSSGCYVYPPVVTTPSPGVELRLDLNDRGRVALGNLIGPSAVNVEGVLQSPPDTAYVLDVTSVTYLRGQTNKWSGEPVRVSKEFVANTTQRTLSKSRTWLTATAMVAGVAVLIASRALTGGGTANPDPGGGGGGGSSFRGVGSFH